VARSNKYDFGKLNILFTTTTLAQIAAASSCYGDSGNKRYSEKLEKLLKNKPLRH
jgi:hypothetical protein